MKYDDDNNEIKSLLRENQRLLIENNQLLKGMRRSSIIGTIFRVIWFTILLGVPVYIYFTYIQPNWDNLKAKVDNLEQVTTELDGAKEWFDSLKTSTKPETVKTVPIQ